MDLFGALNDFVVDVLGGFFDVLNGVSKSLLSGI